MTRRKRFDSTARVSAVAVFEDELKARSDAYVTHLVHGGKADCGEEFYLDALYMAISALREQPRWISVEERLPEESTEVLSFFCVRKIDGTWERYTATAIRLRDAKWLVSDYQNGIEAYSWGTDIEDCCFRVTHWMPLPEPPKEEV